MHYFRQVVGWSVGPDRSLISMQCLFDVLFFKMISQVFCKVKIITSQDSDSATAAEEVATRH